MLLLASTNAINALLAYLLISTGGRGGSGWFTTEPVPGVAAAAVAAGVGALPPSRRAVGGTERDRRPMGLSYCDMLRELYIWDGINGGGERQKK